MPSSDVTQRLQAGLGWSQGGRDCPMKDPFKRPGERLSVIANFALPILLDRAGGEATVSVEEFTALRERFGGAVGVLVGSLSRVPIQP